MIYLKKKSGKNKIVRARIKTIIFLNILFINLPFKCPDKIGFYYPNFKKETGRKKRKPINLFKILYFNILANC